MDWLEKELEKRAERKKADSTSAEKKRGENIERERTFYRKAHLCYNSIIKPYLSNLMSTLKKNGINVDMRLV